MSFKHKLGLKAKDKVTGFKGAIISRCEFLTGCNRYCVQPISLKNGNLVEGIYFDEDQIEVSNKIAVDIKSNKRFKHELGTVGKDKITGFEGVLTARVEFLTGANRYCITSRELKDNKPIVGIYFDEYQIEITRKKGIRGIEVTGTDRGACSTDPYK